MFDYFKKKSTPTKVLNTEHTSISDIGIHLFDESQKVKGKSIFNKDWWYGQVMDWSMKNKEFKTQMFRFVDVLPSLKTPESISKHLDEYFNDKDQGLPGVFGFGAKMGKLAPGLLASTVKKNISEMAQLFITGETPEEALPKILKARKNKIAFTLDLLGEATLSELEAQNYYQRYDELLTKLSQDSQSWEDMDLIDQDHLGPIPKVNISVKMTALAPHISITDYKNSINRLTQYLLPLYLKARKQNIFINLDMEQYEYKNLTLDVFKQLLSHPELSDYPHFGVVLQAYLRDTYADAESLVEFAQQRGTPFSIRLVKGAYWDHEVIHASQNNWNIPVYTKKPESDVNFENCAVLLLKNYKWIKLAVGSHNLRSISKVIHELQVLNLPKSAVEFQMLFGMADAYKSVLIDQGYRIREYATVGKMIPGMAYLVRRLLENTSNESFLRVKEMKQDSFADLMKDPAIGLESSQGEPLIENFVNHAPLDFKNHTERDHIQAELQKIKARLPMDPVPTVVDTQKNYSKSIIKKYLPSDSQKLMGEISDTSLKLGDQAVASAKKAFKTWSLQPAAHRVKLIHKLADLINEKRHYFTALIAHEVGKNWKEADGDVTEAIDFCRYYAEDMLKLSEGIKVGGVPGESSLFTYRPKGVCLVIAPWNFPLAILAGMTASALVTGNSVVMKPAEQSSFIAYELYKLIESLGLPEGTVQFAPGRGEAIGAHLVNHADISLICFTGSKEVGLQIISNAAVVQKGQRHVKNCIVEMGGKNALIVDNDADLDEVIEAVLHSAFGFSGQKCSALSRVIVLKEVYDSFIHRLVESAKSLKIGDTEHPATDVGPVIDTESQARILKLIEDSKIQHKLLFEAQIDSNLMGYYVPHSIFEVADPKSKLAQEEVFGPVLAVLKAKTIDEAIEWVNDSEYALTGGLFSRSPESILKVKTLLEVGNLYINRSITGALVHRHPFGGYKLSGLGSKTGGPGYIEQFMEPQSIIENTTRRGFTPELLS